MSRSKKSDQYREKWDRLPEESAKAYEGFVTYRDMGTNRSIRKVGQALGKSSKLMAEWSSKYGWVERAASWDEEKDRETRQEQLDAIKKMRKSHADLAVAMLVKASKGLLKLQDDELTANSIVAMIETGAKLERLSRGEPSEIKEERRPEDSATNKAIESLATDPGFLAAIQSAYAQTAGSNPAGSPAGPVDSSKDGGHAVEQTAADNPERRG